MLEETRREKTNFSNREKTVQIRRLITGVLIRVGGTFSMFNPIQHETAENACARTMFSLYNLLATFLNNITEFLSMLYFELVND